MEFAELSPEARFIERLGLAAEEEGLPRIAGRLLGLLLLEGGPFSFDELAERLQVSRGSISTNTRLLEARGFLERTGLPGDRHIYYRLAEDPHTGLIANVLRRKRRVLRITREALEELPEDRGEARERLQGVLDFHELVIRKLEAIMEEWNARGATGEESAAGGGRA